MQALSTSTDLDLDQFIGEELTVTLLQPDGSRRAWHGLCTEAGWLGADGGVARYRLRLEPALALLRLRRDSYIFQDKTVQDIVTELLSDHPQVRFEFDISQDQPTRTICTQYRESDLEFFTRLLASEGLNWRFEHDQPQGQDPDSPDGQARHKLVIFDSAAQAPATPGGDELRFHGVRATDTDDAIDSFSARRRVQANAVTIASWDPAQLLAPSAEQQSNLDAGELPVLAVYDGSGERIASGADNGAAADPHSRLMLQALELDNKQFEGAGAVRRLAPGHAFTLTQHERYGPGSDGFVALWVEHEARNNFQAQIKTAGGAGTVENGTYRNRFGCVRDAVAIVPRGTAAAHPVTALGPQTAMVVGLADAVAHTGRDHQVRIQFAWQRGQGANAGGMAHNTDETGNAPGDERSGTWVRVAEALAGPNWGSQFTPRIGTEVLVDFIEGDMDRPVVVAQLYTGADLPPFSAGVDSGANHPGTLSGIHSNNFSGDGYNQWQLDDTQGQVRMRLATSSAATQLNLGYLIQQAPTSAQRGAYRGSGFELRTDAWAVVRGGEGVLLTTTARSAQGAGVTSTQMDAAEALAGFKAAEELAQTLSDAATAQNALVSKNAAAAHKDFVALLDPEQKGKFTGAVNGQEASKAQSGSRELDASQPVEKFGAPLVVMDSPSSINWATPASTVLFAGQQLRWITQGDVQMTAAHTVSSVAANAASFFTHSGGIQAIAANGPVSLQAHTDQLEIVADKSVTVISVNDSIEIKANQKIVLQAGQSSITLEGGDITFACPGNFTVKGGKHVFDGGGNKAAELQKLPDTQVKFYDEAFVLRSRTTGEVMRRQPYRIKRSDSTYEEGFTDEDGHTHLIMTTEQEPLTIELLKSATAYGAPLADTSEREIVRKYQPVAASTTSAIENKTRKDVLIDKTECWVGAHEAEVLSRTSKYSETFALNGESRGYSDPRKFKVYIPLASDEDIVAEIRVRVTPPISFSQDMKDSLEKDKQKLIAIRKARSAGFEKLKERAEAGMEKYLNKKFKIEVIDPECGSRKFSLTYRVVWVDIDEHYTMWVEPDLDRENLTGLDIHVNEKTNEWTFAHEFAHCFGVPDEYGYVLNTVDSVVYTTPDGKKDKPISAPFKPINKNSARATFMSSNSSPTLKARHGWPLAIEIQELLSSKIGRTIKCKVYL